MHLKKKRDRGFTLIELMIAMAVALIVLAAIYRVYQTQQKAYTTQQLVVAMQQNARLAMTLMKREIRMAGYKPAASDGIDNDPPCDTATKDSEMPMKTAKGATRKLASWRPAGIGSHFAWISCRMIQPSVQTGSMIRPLRVRSMIRPSATTGCPMIRTKRLPMRFNRTLPVTARISCGITSTGTIKILAYDIEAIAFGYAFDQDEDGTLDMDTGDAAKYHLGL